MYILITKVAALTALAIIASITSVVAAQRWPQSPHHQRYVSQDLFDSLEELARLVDITYCVGSTGIQSPFQCLSRCDDFQNFELVTTWHTGPLLSDSCGYIALSHPPHPKRLIVAFRGTYSIANTIADLSTVPAKYVPYTPDGEDGDDLCATGREDYASHRLSQITLESRSAPRCENCTVHSGFLTSWRNTRCIVLPSIEKALAAFPDYQLTLVGHSLGGAVAALGSLELQKRGRQPQVTTFGEPRVGNSALNVYLEDRFNLTTVDSAAQMQMYRRVTHASDPVPLLPIAEWGYRAHAGEIYISKYNLPPSLEDLQHCEGGEDPHCIAGPKAAESDWTVWLRRSITWHIPDRFKLWEIFFAHRDYFWRLGLCLPSMGDLWPPFENTGRAQ